MIEREEYVLLFANYIHLLEHGVDAPKALEATAKAGDCLVVDLVENFKKIGLSNLCVKCYAEMRSSRDELCEKCKTKRGTNVINAEEEVIKVERRIARRSAKRVTLTRTKEEWEAITQKARGNAGPRRIDDIKL